MSATVWYVIEIIGFSLAAVLLVLDIILFIKLKVPTLAAEISGKRIEKEVKLIRERTMSGNQRGLDMRRSQRRSMDIVNTMDKGKDTPDRAQDGTQQQSGENSTSVLSYDTTETMILSNKTSVLYDNGATEVLDPDKQFQIVRNIMVLHTDERIL